MTESSIAFVPLNTNSRRVGLQVSVVAALLLSGLCAVAEQLKPFPDHWGEPPPVQTRDYVEWPDGYGHGSGTVAKWIETHLAKDSATGAAGSAVLYSEDFRSVAIGALPQDFMVLNGAFTVQEGAGGDKYLELPGAPIESFAVMFGPAGQEGREVSVRIQAESRGRRHPAFALGLNGLGGYRLKVVPAKRLLELCRGPEESGIVLGTAPLRWESGRWAHLKLRMRATDEGAWRVEGRIWTDGDTEPVDWMVWHVDDEKPLPGRPFVAASPFSGTPVRFDDLMVRAAE